jgi:adenosylcobinamide-phosphate guanylyltransferase
MYAVLMCGGKGTRIASHFKVEKPLIRFRGKPLIEHVTRALIESKYVEKIFAAVSVNTPTTKKFLEKNFSSKMITLETSGKGYSADYLEIIDFFIFEYKKKSNPKEWRIMFIPSDIPLVSSRTIEKIIGTYHEKPCLTVIYEKEFLNKLGLDSNYSLIIDNKEYCYSIEEEYLILNLEEITYNINRFEDLKKASEVVGKN